MQISKLLKHFVLWVNLHRNYFWPSWPVQRKSRLLWMSHLIHLLNMFHLRWISLLQAFWLFSPGLQDLDVYSDHCLFPIHIKPKAKFYSTARARLQEPIDLDELISPSESEKEEDEWRPEKNDRARRGSKKSKMNGVSFVTVTHGLYILNDTVMYIHQDMLWSLLQLYIAVSDLYSVSSWRISLLARHLCMILSSTVCMSGPLC